MIRLSQREDLPLIKTLWMQAFHDSPRETDFYFDHRWREDNLLIDAEAGELHGMISLLPIDLIIGAKAYKARYFFAIATDDRFKRRGISTNLIEHAKVLTKKEGGMAAVLVPANEDLFRFYGKRGFEIVFYYDVCTIDSKDLPPCPLDAVIFKPIAIELLRLRNKCFLNSRLYVGWNEEALNFVIRAAKAWEAPLLRFSSGFGEGYAYCEQDGKTVQVKELALRGMDVMTALCIIHSRLQAESYTVRLQQDSEGFAGSCRRIVPYGMIHWLDKNMTSIISGGTAPYLGLGKD